MNLSSAQAAALAVIDQHGAAFVSSRTWPQANTVDWRSVRALERLGLVEVFLGPDGRFARRVGVPAMTAQHFPRPCHDQPNKGRQTCRVCGLPIERVGRRFASDGVRGQWKHLPLPSSFSCRQT